MKTLHLTLVLLFFGCFSTFAQFQKGSIYLPPTQLYSGSFGIASNHLSASLQSEDSNPISNLTLVAAGGYAFNNQFILWGAGTLGSTSWNQTGSASSINMQLHARYYPSPSSSGSNFFVELGGVSQLDFDGIDRNLWGFQARAGLTHFISPSLALEIGAGPQQIDDLKSFTMYTGLAIYLNNEQSPALSTDRSPIQKGTWLFGTGITDLRILNVADSPTEILLSPQVAYCLSSRFAAGLTFNYRNIFLGGGNARSTSWSLEPQVRYYYFRHAKAAFFVSAGAGPYANKVVLENHTESESGAFYGLGLGGDIFIKPWLGLELGPNFRKYLGTDRTRLGWDLGFRVFL